MSTFITVEEAIESILTQIPRATTERVHLVHAQSRYLAQSIYAPYDSPRFDNSAMDGYAVQFQDLETLPATLPVVASSSAGHPAKEVLQPGQAFHISTGAALPAGADTVVPRELCTEEEGQVIINERPGRGKGANIRRQGSYLKAGEPALIEGDYLGGAEIGLLASFGEPVIEVFRRPTLAIISTGDELLELGQQPGPGQIINSNSYMLEALAASFGANIRVFPTAPDDPKAISDTFETAIAESDLVLSSGGVSVGDHDHVKDVMNKLTGGMAFWKVRMKPGKPLAFGVASSANRVVPLIGLPGNPASSFVGFHLFVRPALSVFQGAAIAQAPLPLVRATLSGDAVPGARGRRAYIAGRVIPDGKSLSFEARADQSSGNPALFAGANALGLVEEGRSQIRPGEELNVHLL